MNPWKPLPSTLKMLPGKQIAVHLPSRFVPQTLPLFRGTFVKVNLDFFPNICHPTKCFLWSFYFGVFLWIHDLLIRSTWPTTWWGRLVGQSYPIKQHATLSQTSFMLKVTILTCQRWPNLRTQKHPCEKTGSFTLSIGGSTRGFLEKEKVTANKLSVVFPNNAARDYFIQENCKQKASLLICIIVWMLHQLSRKKNLANRWNMGDQVAQPNTNHTNGFTGISAWSLDFSLVGADNATSWEVGHIPYIRVPDLERDPPHLCVWIHTYSLARFRLLPEVALVHIPLNLLQQPCQVL